MVLQVFDLVLFFAGFQAGKTQMAAIELHIAQCTQKPPAY
jgi:hypothetical protein